MRCSESRIIQTGSRPRVPDPGSPRRSAGLLCAQVHHLVPGVGLPGRYPSRARRAGHGWRSRARRVLQPGQGRGKQLEEIDFRDAILPLLVLGVMIEPEVPLHGDKEPYQALPCLLHAAADSMFGADGLLAGLDGTLCVRARVRSPGAPEAPCHPRRQRGRSPHGRTCSTRGWRHIGGGIVEGRHPTDPCPPGSTRPFESNRRFGLVEEEQHRRSIVDLAVELVTGLDPNISRAPTSSDLASYPCDGFPGERPRS